MSEQEQSTANSGSSNNQMQLLAGLFGVATIIALGVAIFLFSQTQTTQESVDAALAAGTEAGATATAAAESVAAAEEGAAQSGDDAAQSEETQAAAEEGAAQSDDDAAAAAETQAAAEEGADDSDSNATSAAEAQAAAEEGAAQSDDDAAAAAETQAAALESGTEVADSATEVVAGASTVEARGADSMDAAATADANAVAIAETATEAAQTQVAAETEAEDIQSQADESVGAAEAAYAQATDVVDDANSEADDAQESIDEANAAAADAQSTATAAAESLEEAEVLIAEQEETLADIAAADLPDQPQEPDDGGKGGTTPTSGSAEAIIDSLGISTNNGELLASTSNELIEVNDDTSVESIGLGTNAENFVLYAEFEWGANDVACGFFMRDNDDGFYISTISSTGTYTFWVFTDEDFVGDESTTDRSDLINTKGTNQFVAVGSGDTITLFINGEYADEFSNDRNSRGSLGLMAILIGDEGESHCNFTEAWSWELEDEVSVSSMDNSGGGKGGGSSLPAEVADGLELAGIDEADGTLTVENLEVRIDLSDTDNTISRSEWTDGPYENFVIGATIGWGPGADEDACGIMFRRTDESYYAIMMDQEQNLFLVYFDDGEQQDGIFDDSSLINTGKGDNVITIVAVDDRFSVFLNGEYVVQFRNDDLTSGNVMGAAITLDESEDTWCDFQDVWVFDLGSGGPSLSAP